VKLEHRQESTIQQNIRINVKLVEASHDHIWSLALQCPLYSFFIFYIVGKIKGYQICF